MKDQSLDIWRTLMEKGTTHLAQADYMQAENYFRRATRIAIQLDVPLVKAFSLRLMATVQVKQGKIEAAERGFREALQICEEVSNYKGMSEAFAGLASIAVEKNNMESAVFWFNRAIEIYPNESPPLRLAMLYSDLGQVYSTQERWSDAQVSYKNSLDLCHRYNYPKGEGELSVLIGETCYRQGNKKEAIDHIRHSCKVFAGLGIEISLANALLYYAFMKFEQQSLADALLAMQRALILQMRNQLGSDASESAYFIAKILQGLEYLDEAQYYIELSIQYCTDLENSLAIRLQSLGKLMVNKEEYGQAKRYFLEASTIFEQLGDDLRLGECYEYLAFLLDAMGEEEEGEFYEKEAKRMIAGYHAHSLSAVQRLAEYYEGRRQYLDALQCFWQSIEIAHDIGYETIDLERAVQRVSRKIRHKK
ncbi:tetratricopeptide repeat protein [Desulfitobacterium sp. THU1]|uniref:tetratricopeptide repeat protein n=1 Tax=Desulfitobacterium sp. THU1 TaxID=3138072 RepID=UPI00311EF27D